MKSPRVVAFALAALSGVNAQYEQPPDIFRAGRYDSGEMHMELMARKKVWTTTKYQYQGMAYTNIGYQATWDRQIASGAMDSTQYKSHPISAAAAPVQCINGTAKVVPGDRLNTFKCNNVCCHHPC